MGGPTINGPNLGSKRIVVKKIKMVRKRVRAESGLVRKPTDPSTESSLFSASQNKKTERIPTTKKSFGLPSFHYRAKPSNSETLADSTSGARMKASNEANDSSSFYPKDDGQEYEIPSDTLMAMKSLIQSDQGLHVPITNNGSVQVVLENQIYSIFDEGHASNVNSELLELIHNNNLRRMYCHDSSYVAFILTEDFVRAVWDAHLHPNHSSSHSTEVQGSSEEIVSWFLSNLCHWTKSKISESCLEDRWKNNNIISNNDVTLKDAVHYLLTSQFLIRDPKQNLSIGGNEESYFLWLPQWGIVLRAWSKARRQLLALITQRKELSKHNVLQKNRHCHVSTEFLLNDLIYKEKIRIVERPFGSFVQLVRDT